ncbi:hypothetical protein CCAN2_1780009 [Capnocytophaga canimorsus]|nr:hypothetical protein CCAN2_1780009 [Capnocytophaga canimorsus]
MRGKIAIIGIAKRLEEIYFPEDSIPLYLDKKSETLKVIQQLRNEAHRFGITFHRQKRSKAAIVSELDNIEGIGEKTKEALLKHFKSVKRIREANLEELENIAGYRGKGFEYFRPTSSTNNNLKIKHKRFNKGEIVVSHKLFTSVFFIGYFYKF